MRYTLEEIYLLVGREDKTAGLTFRSGSESAKVFGQFLTVLFLYSQKEREELDELVKVTPYSKVGYLRARNLVNELTNEQEKHLTTIGINSEDIIEILYFTAPEKNTFHSSEKRSIRKIEVKMNTLAKGRDLDWMYGFKKRLVSDGVGLCPAERFFYLAGKFYYEPDELTEDEVNEIYPNDAVEMREEVEWELLSIKYMREEISLDEKKKLAEILSIRKKLYIDLLDKYLKQAGSSMKRLVQKNIDQAVELYMRVDKFKERRLNVTGTMPIFIDIHSYLHIYMRHVEEMKVTEHFEEKDNFLWEEQDIFSVMQQVIRHVNEEIQAYFAKNPGKRYSRYGGQSVYYQGDYYTFHIEPDGRVSTFHRNKKEHDKKAVVK